MKIAVTSQGTSLDAEIDPRFGRAAYILIVDTDTLAFEVVDNSINVNAFKGAGIKAATTVFEKGAKVLLTGYCGPKAFQTFEAVGVKVVSDIAGTVEEVVMNFKNGKFEYTDAANAEAHW